MGIKVCKFGGTSMASAKSILQVAEIVKSEADRHIVVVSAPGKRFKEDEKVTDLLYSSFAEAQNSGDCSKSFSKVRARFIELINELKIKLDLTKKLDEIEKKINNSVVPDYAASRGEYLSALLLSKLLGYKFYDAADLVKFSENGVFNADYTNDLIKSTINPDGYYVVPGFYGSQENGNILTFSRGGSDVSGSIFARGVNAEIYENWTDVDGFMTADPRIVEKPNVMKILSYTELRELAYMGANVLHPESIFPVRISNIPINIKNTFNPTAPGTMIVPDASDMDSSNIVTGIAGKKGFTVIVIEKSMMNSEVGFGRRLLSVLEQCGICFEHMPSGIDTISLVISDTELNGKLEKVINRIRENTNPDDIHIQSGLALIATVGHNMASRPGTAAKLFTALAAANINVRMIDQGSSELNLIIGVNIADCERAINAIYHAFF